ncbi:MAG: hypothetical protein ACYDGN_09210 [Acidimicrobiales bacterium]
MDFWVYERSTGNSVATTVHAGYCGFCFHGCLIRTALPARWLGPYQTLTEAEAVAEGLGRRYRRCGKCLREGALIEFRQRGDVIEAPIRPVVAVPERLTARPRLDPAALYPGEFWAYETTLGRDWNIVTIHAATCCHCRHGTRNVKRKPEGRNHPVLEPTWYGPFATVAETEARARTVRRTVRHCRRCLPEPLLQAWRGLEASRDGRVPVRAAIAFWVYERRSPGNSPSVTVHVGRCGRCRQGTKQSRAVHCWFGPFDTLTDARGVACARSKRATDCGHCLGPVTIGAWRAAGVVFEAGPRYREEREDRAS